MFSKSTSWAPKTKFFGGETIPKTRVKVIAFFWPTDLSRLLKFSEGKVCTKFEDKVKISASRAYRSI